MAGGCRGTQQPICAICVKGGVNRATCCPCTQPQTQVPHTSRSCHGNPRQTRGYRRALGCPNRTCPSDALSLRISQAIPAATDMCKFMVKDIFAPWGRRATVSAAPSWWRRAEGWAKLEQPGINWANNRDKPSHANHGLAKQRQQRQRLALATKTTQATLTGTGLDHANRGGQTKRTWMAQGKPNGTGLALTHGTWLALTTHLSLGSDG